MNGQSSVECVPMNLPAAERGLWSVVIVILTHCRLYAALFVIEIIKGHLWICSKPGRCFSAIAVQVLRFSVYSGEHFAIWHKICTSDCCACLKRKACTFLATSSCQQSFFLIFYGLPPQCRQGQMDDCCSLWSRWQRDQQSHNAPQRAACQEHSAV